MALKTDAKFEGKLTFVFKNDMMNLANFHQSLFESLKLLLSPFIQSRKFMSLKFTGELCAMTIKNDEKFEQELTCQFRRNLTNFDHGIQKFQKFALQWAAFDQSI